ncbi:MAG TPA: hypothetical protein VGD56_11745 [Gemmatirosa sp.]
MWRSRATAQVGLAVVAAIASATGTASAQSLRASSMSLPPLPPTPIPYPERRPQRPPGGLPQSCLEFKGPASAHPHWEQQTTVLSRIAMVNGQSRRVADASVTMIARRNLNEVTLDQFAAGPQAFAQVDFDREHNGLPAGRYCLVLRYEPTVGGRGGDPFDRKLWHMFLYDLSAPAAPASAVVPFLSRQPAPNDSTTPRPYPPVRFNFVVVRIPTVPSGGRSAVRSRGYFAATAGYMAVWGACVPGCCTGALEGLHHY